jgi:hypothetical protein
MKTITIGPPAIGHRCHRSNRNRSSDFTAGEAQHEDPSNTPEQEPTTKVIAATKPSLIIIDVAAQATTRIPRIVGHQPRCHVRPTHREVQTGARSSKQRPKEEAHRPTKWV